jgi:recombination protein RecA
MAKDKSIEETIKDLNRIYGTGTIGRKSELPKQEIIALPSGCLAFDYASGIGGWARGRFSAIWGPKGTWKSTIILGAERVCQEMDLAVVHIEQERKYTDVYAIEQGIDINMDDYYYSEPDTIEEVLDVICALICSSDEIGVIAVDSVGVMLPQFLEGQNLKKGKDEEGKTTGKNPTASQARALNSGIPRVLYHLRKQSKKGKMLPAIIFVQHARLNPGAGMFADPEYMPGGFQFEHSLTTKIRLKPGATEKEKTTDSKVADVKEKKEKTSMLIHGLFEKQNAASEHEGATFEFEAFNKSRINRKSGINIIKDRKTVGLLSNSIRIKGGGYSVWRGSEEKRLLIKTEERLSEYLAEQDYFDIYNAFIADAPKKGE